jgi:amidase
MHGIPVLRKDNIDATPMVNSGGSLRPRRQQAQARCLPRAALARRGRVILGKTNLSEWVQLPLHARDLRLERDAVGRRRNPYALDRNPCGRVRARHGDRGEPRGGRRRHGRRRQRDLPGSVAGSSA